MFGIIRDAVRAVWSAMTWAKDLAAENAALRHQLDVALRSARPRRRLTHKLGINVWELIKLANRHPRVNILQPGPGVGGHCIAVDPWFIVSAAPTEAKLIRAAREVNDSKPEWVIEKVKLAVANYLMAHPDKTAKDVTIACYGLAFKPDIDDLRESPALEIAKTLTATHPGRVLCVEPNLPQEANTAHGLPLTNLQNAVVAAHIHIVLVNHRALHQELKQLPHKNSIVDSCGMFNK